MDWGDFKEWLNKKYSKTWVPTVFCYAKKYHGMLNGNLRDLDSFSKSKKNHTLKALIALSKYLGVYEQFKVRIKSYGIKWGRQNSFQAFLRIMNVKEGLMEWIKECMNVLDSSQALFVKFVVMSGLRKGEALNAFNMIVRLNQEGKLHEHYNLELESLEHFRFENVFIRGTKNAFFSFVPKRFIEQVAACKLISYSTLRKRLKRHGMKSRLNELRDYFATYMVHHGVIREEVDLLQGRVGRSIFMRHYFSPTVRDLKNRVLKAINEIEI